MICLCVRWSVPFALLFLKLSSVSMATISDGLCGDEHLTGPSAVSQQALWLWLFLEWKREQLVFSYLSHAHTHTWLYACFACFFVSEQKIVAVAEWAELLHSAFNNCPCRKELWELVWDVKKYVWLEIYIIFKLTRFVNCNFYVCLYLSLDD